MAQDSKSTSSTTTQITIPHNYTPRAYQLKFWRAMESGIKRAVKVWPRRTGKDKTDLNFTISRMFPENKYGRIGTYFHFFPTYAQGKKVIWDGIDKRGFKVMDHFPREIIRSKNESELQVTLVNGSIYQVIGTDNIDSVVGTNPAGCVFSEYALQDPRAWMLIKPILAENGGWASFNFTPRGFNHAKDLYDMAKDDPLWFCELLTCMDTLDENGQRVISDETLEQERREGMAEELVQQEYFCSFAGFQEGSYYTKQIQLAQTQGRITDVPWNSSRPVFTFWDIGIGDSAAIWFVQLIGSRVNVIDYYETSGEGIAYYAKFLRAKPYTFSRHYWPHDGRNRDFSTGEVRRDVGERLGIKPIDIVPRKDVDDGIEAVRNILSRCYFDKEKCRQGINALSSYKKERDEVRKEFKNKPYHDWSSHGADAFRTMAMSDFETVSQGETRVRIESEFDPREPYRDSWSDVTVESEFTP